MKPLFTIQWQNQKSIGFASLLAILCTTFIIGSSAQIAMAVSVDTRIYAEAFGSQINPQVAVLNDNTIMVVWQNFDGNSIGVYGTVLYPNLTKIYPDTRISTKTNFGQINPQIAVQSDDNIVVVWQCYDGNSNGVYGTVLYPNLTIAYVETRISTKTTFGQIGPQIAVLNDNTIMVAWQCYDGNSIGVYGTVLYPNLTKKYPDTRISSKTIYGQLNPQIAVLSDNTIIAVWQGYDGQSNGTFGNVLDYNLTKIHDDTRISTKSVYSQSNPEVAVLNDKTIMVSWQFYDGSSVGIFGTVLYPNLTKKYPDTRISTKTKFDQTIPQIAVMGDDTIMVAWQGFDGRWDGIYGTVLYPNLTKIYPDTRISTKTQVGSQLNPQIAVLSDNNIMAVWQFFNGNTDAIFGNVFYPDLKKLYVDTRISTEAIDGTLKHH